MVKVGNTEVPESALRADDAGGYVVNMDDVPEVSTEVIKRGVYNAVISECEYKLSQASGMPMWAMILEITDGEYQGRKLYENMSFSIKALPFTKRKLARFAPELVQGSLRPDDDDVLNSLLGRDVRVKTKVGKNDNNEPRTEVAEILPPADSNSFLAGAQQG